MMELWILLTLVAVGLAFAAWNKVVRGRKPKANEEGNERKIYPLW